jgi:Predicted transcriptional regulators
MSDHNKTYKTIGEVAKLLNLIDKKTGRPSTHTIRFWEKEFKQIRPHIFSGKRRYFDNSSIEVLKKIKHL